MTEQWRELKETIIEMRDNNGTLIQQEVCKFLANYMEVLEKQMQEPCDTVSRAEAIDKLTKFYNMVLDDNGTKLNIRDIVGILERLPSVTPKGVTVTDFADKCRECGKMLNDKLQPCEDCISRQAVLEGLTSIAKAKAKSDAQKSMMGRCMFFVEQLPSVKPQYTDEKIDRAQAVEQAYVDKMMELAVEETKRPKGKWIEIEIDAGEFIYKCTKCGMRVINPYKYCPMCGSYNGGGEDEVSD